MFENLNLNTKFQKNFGFPQGFDISQKMLASLALYSNETF